MDKILFNKFTIQFKNTKEFKFNENVTITNDV